MSLFNINSVIENSSGFGLPFSDTIWSATLAADTDTLLTVPGGSSLGKPMDNVNKFIAVFSYEDETDTFVRLNAVADEPAGAAFAAGGSELAPNARYCEAGDIIHARSIGGGDIVVAFYAI